MSGVSAITNPLNDREVLLFTVSAKKQLAVEIRNLDNSSYTAYQDEGCVDGVVRPTTKLGAAIHQRTLTVYGVTTFTSGGNTMSTVSSLSAVYNPIDNVASPKASPGAYNAIAAAGDGLKKDWVYFLQDQAEKQKPKILEYEFNLSNSKTRTVYERMNPDPSSNLAVILHAKSGARMVMFQGYDERTLYYGWSSGKTEADINVTGNALKGTPLAASTVRMDDGAIEVYLYYFDDRMDMYRVVYSGTDSSGQWGAPQKISNASRANTTTGITVIPDVVNGVNHVFYVAGSDIEYSDIQDPFRVRELSAEVNVKSPAYIESMKKQVQADAEEAEAKAQAKQPQHHHQQHHEHENHSEQQNGHAAPAEVPPQAA